MPPNETDDTWVPLAAFIYIHVARLKQMRPRRSMHKLSTSAVRGRPMRRAGGVDYCE